MRETDVKSPGVEVASNHDACGNNDEVLHHLGRPVPIPSARRMVDDPEWPHGAK